MVCGPRHGLLVTVGQHAAKIHWGFYTGQFDQGLGFTLHLIIGCGTGGKAVDSIQFVTMSSHTAAYNSILA